MVMTSNDKMLELMILERRGYILGDRLMEIDQLIYDQPFNSKLPPFNPKVHDQVKLLEKRRALLEQRILEDKVALAELINLDTEDLDHNLLSWDDFDVKATVIHVISTDLN